MALEPEQYRIPPNEYAPNSRLPVLIYRDVLPLPLSEDRTTAFLESHGWEKRGVGAYPRQTFSPKLPRMLRCVEVDATRVPPYLEHIFTLIQLWN